MAHRRSFFRPNEGLLIDLDLQVLEPSFEVGRHRPLSERGISAKPGESAFDEILVFVLEWLGRYSLEDQFLLFLDQFLMEVLQILDSELRVDEILEMRLLRVRPVSPPQVDEAVNAVEVRAERRMECSNSRFSECRGSRAVDPAMDPALDVRSEIVGR
jgi:hypothetical protein